MSRHRYRRAPFADVIDWTDYRWGPGSWQGPVSRPWSHHPRRGFSFARLLFAGLAILAGVKLINAIRNDNGSWARKGLYAALLLVIAAAFSNSRRRRRYW